MPSRRARLVLGCKAGLRSTPACALLAGAGYSRLLNMAGGFDAWAAAGLPVERGPHRTGAMHAEAGSGSAKQRGAAGTAR